MLKEEVLACSREIAQDMINHRRYLHAHAETGFALKETLPYVCKALEDMGYCVSDCGKAGLTATVGKPGGKVLLLRADMDALPISEEADVPFASKNGNMHACGHDMHTAMLLGAAKVLKQRETELKGMVKFMFQSAEETFEGSKNMIENGVLTDPKPDAAMMIHVTAGLPLPAGTVIVSSPGVSAPAADYFTIQVQGKGCHGSAPQNGIDPITAAAHILLALQEIHARELSSTEEAVLTIGKFHGGTAENVIADSVTMGGTIRTYDEKIRAFLKERMTDISRGIASAFRATAEVSFGSGCPTLVNDKTFGDLVAGYMTELFGQNGAFTTAQLSGGKPSRGGGSEDFAYISQEVPAVMLALAAGEPKNGHKYPQHHPKVTFDEDALPYGCAAFVWTAFQYLS